MLVAFATVAGVIAASSYLAYDAIPERQVIVIYPTAVVTPTPVPYRPAGPDPGLPAAYDRPLVIPLPPRTAMAVQPREGPGEGYPVLGALQADAPVQVIGRDERGAWLAIVFPPQSTLRAWLPARHVLGVPEIEQLPLEPVDLPP